MESREADNTNLEADTNEDITHDDIPPSNEVDDDHHTSQPLTGDGASPGKIFIGGLARETTAAQFVKHFGKYGEITDSVIMKDRRTGQPRGFGFITYGDASVVDTVIQESHILNGKQVEIKRTIPKGAIGSKDFKTKKIFVGGIPTTVNEDVFNNFFSKFGVVKEHQIMRDHASNRSRGFGFVTFETEEAVDKLLSKGNIIEFAGTKVEIKKAEPKKPTAPAPSAKCYNDSRSSYGGGFGNDTYGGYGGGGYGPASYRAGAAYGARASGYGGYGANEFGGYGGYGAGAMSAYRGDLSYGYSSRYGGGGSFSRGYDMGSGYGGPSDGYGAYGGAAAGSGYGAGSGHGGGSESAIGGGYGGSSGRSLYGSGGGSSARGGFGGAAANGRYHPYSR